MNPRDYRLPFAARHAAVATDTTEVRAVLANDTPRTGSVKLPFTKPVCVVGFKATVRPVLPLVGGGLLEPTADDIEVSLGREQDRRYTSLRTESGASGSGFVTLSALDVNDGDRLLLIMPDDTRNTDFDIEFGWVQPDGADQFESAHIALSVFYRYLDRDEVEALFGKDR